MWKKYKSVKMDNYSPVFKTIKFWKEKKCHEINYLLFLIIYTKNKKFENNISWIKIAKNVRHFSLP